MPRTWPAAWRARRVSSAASRLPARAGWRCRLARQRHERRPPSSSATGRSLPLHGCDCSRMTVQFCPQCRAELAPLAAMEDGGRARAPALPTAASPTGTTRRRCWRPSSNTAARCCWPETAPSGPLRRLITGFMEAGGPEDGIRREIAEETVAGGCAQPAGRLGVQAPQPDHHCLRGRAHGEIRLSPELAEY